MAYAQIKDYDRGTVRGRFAHKETGAVFEYCKRGEEWADFSPDMPHLICVNDPIGWPYRFGHVLGSVAYIVTDEALDGSPIVQKWPIKSHKRYK
jgi:hypothetical protein